jgi:predicted secreted protein
MSWFSIVAIYALFWILTAFIVLPIGIRSQEELGMAKIPGQADGVPGNFRPLQFFIRNTLLSAALFGLFYANYVYGWIDRHSFDFLIQGQQ